MELAQGSLGKHRTKSLQGHVLAVTKINQLHISAPLEGAFYGFGATAVALFLSVHGLTAQHSA